MYVFINKQLVNFQKLLRRSISAMPGKFLKMFSYFEFCVWTGLTVFLSLRPSRFTSHSLHQLRKSLLYPLKRKLTGSQVFV